MKTIYLIRHGQASFGATDYDQLSELGVRQSQLLGQSLLAKAKGYDYIVQGTLNRQRQTTQHALGNKFDVSTDAHWNEFDHREITKIHLKHEGLTSANFSNLDDAEKMRVFSLAVGRWMHSEKSDSSYAENAWQFKQRVQQALDQTIKQTEKVGLVFTSGGVISTLIGQCLDFNIQQVIRLNWQLVNTGVTKVLVSKNGIALSTLNEYVHLENESNHKIITYR